MTVMMLPRNSSGTTVGTVNLVRSEPKVRDPRDRMSPHSGSLAVVEPVRGRCGLSDDGVGVLGVEDAVDQSVYISGEHLGNCRPSMFDTPIGGGMQAPAEVHDATGGYRIDACKC